jgi:SsrA-binding protein
MHKSEILKLYMKTRQDGLTLVPLRLYFKNGRVKAEIGLCRGKKLYDKREAMAQRDEKRENERYVKSASRLGD